MFNYYMLITVIRGLAILIKKKKTTSIGLIITKLIFFIKKLIETIHKIIKKRNLDKNKSLLFTRASVIEYRNKHK